MIGAHMMIRQGSVVGQNVIEIQRVSQMGSVSLRIVGVHLQLLLSQDRLFSLSE